MAGLAQGIACGQSDFAAPACLVLGGETTVTIRGQGSGGRNQELALAAAIALDGYPLPDGVEVAVVSLGTDGTDGPTDAAGGIAMARHRRAAAAPWAWMPAPRWQKTTATTISARWVI